jgi:hypothetical protein
MGHAKYTRNFNMETMKRRDHMGDLDVDESMILN